MAVVVGELRRLRLRVQRRDVLQKIGIVPQPARHGPLGVRRQRGALLPLGRISLLLRPEQRAVGLVVPHRVAEVRVHERVRLMHVARHALARRYGARELVLERMSLLVLRDRRIGGERLPVVAVARVAAGIRGIAVVRVDDVAGRAAAGAVVAGMIVRAEERQMRIVEPRLVEVDEPWADARASAAAAIAETDVGPSRFLAELRIADVGRR